jgi:hypothetical protein
LDNSAEDQNPEIGQVEIHRERSGQRAEYYLVASYGGSRSHGWMEKYEHHAQTGPITGLEERSYQQITNGRVKSARVTKETVSATLNVSQEIHDMRNPEESYDASWLMA